MQLKTQTDYAIRILLYLADKEGYTNAKEMSEALGMPENYLPKVTRKLRNAGWVTSSAGIAGGFEMVVHPKDITLFDVMTVMEDTVRINRCLEDDGYCSRYATATCPVHGVYAIYQAATEQYFSSVTILDLLKGRDNEKKLLEVLREFVDTEYGSL